MYLVCIAIVDAAHARLFEFERISDAEGLSDRLTERTDLVNPARRLPLNALFSDSHRGLNHASDHGYSFDDHREAHMSRLDAEFARLIVTELGTMVSEADRLVICASPRMLGQLRDVVGSLHRPGLIIDEIARDLVKLTGPQIRDRLVTYGLLPAPLPRPTLDERRL